MQRGFKVIYASSVHGFLTSTSNLFLVKSEPKHYCVWRILFKKARTSWLERWDVTKSCHHWTLSLCLFTSVLFHSNSQVQESRTSMLWMQIHIAVWSRGRNGRWKPCLRRSNQSSSASTLISWDKSIKPPSSNITKTESKHWSVCSGICTCRLSCLKVTSAWLKAGYRRRGHALAVT